MEGITHLSSLSIIIVYTGNKAYLVGWDWMGGWLLGGQ